MQKNATVQPTAIPRLTPPSRYVGPAEARQILSLRRQGQSQAAIVRLTGRSNHTIVNVLKREGAPLKRVFAVKRGVTTRCRRITELARLGHTEREIAQLLGLTVHQVRNTVNRSFLKEATGLIFSAELAAELGVSQKTLARAVRLRQFEAGFWMTSLAFTNAQAQAVRAHYAAHVTAEDTETWLDSAQVARELGMSVDTFHWCNSHGDPRTAGIRRVRVLGATGRTHRYDPRTVLAAAQRLPKRNLPLNYRHVGLIPSKVLAQLANRSVDAVNTWATRGCLHRRDRTGTGRYWFDTEAVLTWLDAQTQPLYHRAAGSLRRNLEQRRAA